MMYFEQVFFSKMIAYNTSLLIQRVIILFPFWISHGTKCAGVIAAEANNSFCGVGIAYSANISGKQVLHLFGRVR